MKIKNDFITNSSSTSYIYCMWCTCIPIEEFPVEILKEVYDRFINESPECISYEDFILSLPLYSEKYKKYFIETLKSVDLDYAIDFDLYYIGRHISGMRDNETLRQFKDSVINSLKRLNLKSGIKFKLFELKDLDEDYEDDEE